MSKTIIKALQTPGEHRLELTGHAGNIEAALIVPDNATANQLLFLGHPHSLQGGSMNNKVVTTLARAARDVGLASLRFNFRGVGLSEGVYDDGIGESEDLITLARTVRQQNSDCIFLFAGFSFGSYVAYRSAAQIENRLLLTVAPPVERYDYQAFDPAPANWEIIMGDADEVVDFDGVVDFAHHHQPPISLQVFAQTSHFFHGQLVKLRQHAADIFTQATQS